MLPCRRRRDAHRGESSQIGLSGATRGQGAKRSKLREDLSREFGAFGVAGAKLGSYTLNRWQNHTTITKDMWYARTLARMSGEPLVVNGKVLTKPWRLSKADLRKRVLADRAWGQVADELGMNPADVQQAMWDMEHLLYRKMGVAQRPTYISDGLRHGIEEHAAGRQLGELVEVPRQGAGTDGRRVRSKSERRAQEVGRAASGGVPDARAQAGDGRGAGSEAGVIQGAVSFSPHERPVVHLFTGAANVSTLVHESAHIWRRTLGEGDLVVLQKHFGEVGSRAAEEKFSRQFENYLRSGKAPTPELQGVFDRFSTWLTEIYRKVKNSPIEENVHPDVKEVFDRMLGAKAAKPTRTTNTGLRPARRPKRDRR